MIVKNKIGYLLQGRAVADAERKSSQNGKDFVSISLRVDSRPGPEGGKYKYEGEVVYVSCWHELADAALHIQKGDRLEAWVYELERKEGQSGPYFRASAEAIIPDIRVMVRMAQTYSNAARMVETTEPTPFDGDAAPEADLSAPLDATDADDLPF